MLKKILFCSFLFLGLQTSAYGLDYQDQCRPALNKYCKNIPESRELACLTERYNKLTSLCRVSIQSEKARIGIGAKSCDADRKKFCPNVTPGGHRVQKCLEAYEDQLSGECRAYRDQTRGSSHNPLRGLGVCAEDQARYCGGVKPGGDRLFECLRLNRPRLTRDCREHVELKTQRQDVTEACEKDFDRHCPASRFKPAQRRACIERERGHFSQECRMELRDLDRERRD